MLENIDLNQKIDKKVYKRIMPELQERLYNVQKRSWDAGLPVVILFEGWDAAGKGTAIQGLTAPLDPRGFKLYPIRAARTYEKKRPWLWRFWLKLPARGEWAIFDRSWYWRVLAERVEEVVSEKEWRRGYRDIVNFERALADDNCCILKFFLHISKSEQKKRFEKLSKDPLTAWHVAPEDWVHNRRHEDWLMAYEECFERTDTEWGPWTIVAASDRRFARVKIFSTIIQALEGRLGIEAGPLPGTIPEPEEVEEPGAEEAAEEAVEEDVDVEPEDEELEDSGVEIEDIELAPEMQVLEEGPTEPSSNGTGSLPQAETGPAEAAIGGQGIKKESGEESGR